MNDIERIDWWSKERIEAGLFTPSEKKSYDILYDIIKKRIEALWPKPTQN